MTREPRWNRYMTRLAELRAAGAALVTNEVEARLFPRASSEQSAPGSTTPPPEEPESPEPEQA